MTTVEELRMRDGLLTVADQVKVTWLASDYPAAVQDDASQFRHAAIHASKAIGQIMALIDHAEHERLREAEAVCLREHLPNLLADLVRCAAKMAEVSGIDFALAYIQRAKQLADRWGHGQ